MFPLSLEGAWHEIDPKRSINFTATNSVIIWSKFSNPCTFRSNSGQKKKSRKKNQY